MKIVLDTNTYVSSFRNDGNPRVIFRRALNKSDVIYITDEIIEEIARVVKKPKLKFREEEQKRIVATIKMIATKITIDTRYKAPRNACRDNTDIKFLECAAAAKADYIVSGDLDLLDMKEYCGIKIINAKNYLDIVS